MPQYYNYRDDDRGGFLGGFLGNIPKATRNIFLVNVLVFIATSINREFMFEYFAWFFPKSPFFHWWQAVTYMFMHGGFWHIFANMWGLLMFGSILERTIGYEKFLKVYFLSGIGALLLHTGVQFIEAMPLLDKMAQGDAVARSSYYDILRTPMLGASGAVFGIQVAYAMLYPDTVLTLMFPPVSMRAKWFVAVFIGIELLTGITGTAAGIAHFAHLGGALVGFLLIAYWKKKGTLWN